MKRISESLSQKVKSPSVTTLFCIAQGISTLKHLLPTHLHRNWLLSLLLQQDAQISLLPGEQCCKVTAALTLQIADVHEGGEKVWLDMDKGEVGSIFVSFL